MPIALTKLTDLAKLAFDEIIDVRSPAEFAEDHIPGAINLPALTNDERARVGTIYVQDDPFQARKIGAALVSRNVARHLEGPLAAKDGRSSNGTGAPGPGEGSASDEPDVSGATGRGAANHRQ